MANNARKHLIPAGADKSFNRATIFETFGNSINDIVPVANATERAQVVANMVAAGAGPTAVDPLVVIRGDAPGLHRIEYTYDGSVWLSDVLAFASKTAADTFGAANSGLLSVGDRCRVGTVEYSWAGTVWAAVNARIGMRRSTTAQAISNTVYQDLSATANWVEEYRVGIDPYASGITVPVAGDYEVSYAVSATQSIFTGVSVNKDTIVLSDLSIAATGILTQGVATATASGKITLPASGKVRLWGIASAAGATMRTEPGLSFFQIQRVQ